MINITIAGENRLKNSALQRLLSDEISFNPRTITTPHWLEYTTQTAPHPEVIIYCTDGYSNSLTTQVKQIDKMLPKVKKILILSMAHKHFIRTLLNSGIDAIISYKSSPDELIQAVNLAMFDQQYLSEDLSRTIIKSKYSPCFNSLSQRELEITFLLANGMNVKSVSSELDISPKTVNTYRYRIFNKLEIDKNIDLFHLVNEQASYMLGK